MPQTFPNAANLQKSRCGLIGPRAFPSSRYSPTKSASSIPRAPTRAPVAGRWPATQSMQTVRSWEKFAGLPLRSRLVERERNDRLATVAIQQLVLQTVRVHFHLAGGHLFVRGA